MPFKMWFNTSLHVMVTGASPGQRDVPSGACLQRLGCPLASGHSEGDGNYIVGRAVERRMTSGVGGPRWTHVVWWSSFPGFHHITSVVKAVALLWAPSPMPALENMCTDIAGDQREDAATLQAGF